MISYFTILYIIVHYRAGNYSSTISSLAPWVLLHPQPLPSPFLEESWPITGTLSHTRAPSEHFSRLAFD